MFIRKAREADFGRVMELYRQLQPSDPVLNDGYAVIENVITDESVRRKGYGKRIVTHAIEEAWAAGCYKVMLLTGSKREATHAFYRACGFSGDAKQAFIARRA